MKSDKNGKKNLCGQKIRQLREALPGNVSQKQFAETLTLMGLKIDGRTVRDIENGDRCIYDLELIYIVKALGVSYRELFEDMKHEDQ